MDESGASRPIGLVELARIAGVSASTVSRALNDNPRIAVATRARIQGLAKAHGFRLNLTASALRRRRTGAIAVVVPLGHERGQHVSDPFFMSLIAGLADALTERGYDLLLSRVIPADTGWLEALLESGRVDGAIVVGQSDQTQVIEAAAAKGLPFVVWGAAVEGGRQVTVGTDNVAGGRLAAEHLIARGRKRLAFLGNPDVPELAARLAGARQAVTAAKGVELKLLPVHLTTEASYEEAAALLTGRDLPDGVIAASDVVAMSVVQALAERGIAAPRDVAVVGYDDIAVARHATPPLTTIRQDVPRGARLLVELLMKRLAGEEAHSVCMAPQLIVRGSA